MIVMDLGQVACTVLKRQNAYQGTCWVQPHGVPAAVKFTQCSTPFTRKRWLVTQNSAQLFSSLPWPAAHALPCERVLTLCLMLEGNMRGLIMVFALLIDLD